MKGGFSFDVFCYMYVIDIYVFIILAHLICLCLAMMVYAVHVSREYCRWNRWSVG